ncbi:MAG: TolC family protein [Nitrospirae bacterium]|nr:TolC family protein [Nitrospirota bacterium]
MNKRTKSSFPLSGAVLLMMGFLATSVGVSPSYAETEEPLSLSLEEALRLAFEKSPVLRARKAEFRQAEANMMRARIYPFNPELEVGGGDRQGVDGSSTDREILLSQELQIGGQRRKEISVEQAALVAAEYTLRRERRLLAFEVEISFAETLARRELVEIAQADAELTRGLLDFSQRRLEAGAGTQIELNLARAAAGRVEGTWRQAIGGYKAASQRLGELIGLSPERRVNAVGEIPLPVEELVPLDQFVQLAVDNRADLNASRHRIDSADNAIRLAKSLAIPNLKLGLFYAEEEGTDEIKGLGLQLPIPLFNRNQGGIARAEATSERQVAETAALELTVRREVADAYVTYLAAKESADALHDLVVGTLEENLSFLQRALQAGKINAAEVLVFRREFVASQREYIEALFEAWAAKISLDLATGSTRLPLSYQEETTP